MYNVEIERKFLLKECNIIDILRLAPNRYTQSNIIQAYIAVEENYSKRIRKDNDTYILTEKEGSDMMQRKEYEKEITQDEFEELIQHALGTIEKTRYRFETDEFKEVCIDIFTSPITSIVAEIEYKSSTDAQKLPVPPWLDKLILKEVTHDKSYLNSQIALKGRL